jgi:hypothetical protein
LRLCVRDQLPRLWQFVRLLLDGVNAASLGLLIRFKVNSTWLILGGAMTGVLKAAFG